MLNSVESAFAFYQQHGAALFPIPYGSKAPYGIVQSFAHDWSKSTKQWAAWRESHPNCNFGLVAGPSRLIVVDVDVAEVGHEAAWGYWAEWCRSRDLPVFTPTVQSARGGWHLLFSLPDSLDIATLRQSPLVGKIEGVSKKAIIDLRVGSGFVVAAGSYYDGTAKGEASGTYILFPNAQVHLAPTALLAACARPMPKPDGIALVGSWDRDDVAALLQWMTEREMFSEYSEWLGAGLALKIEYGDDALSLWELTHNETVTADVIASKWNSFATDPKSGMTTINSLMQRAHAMGWKGTIRKSTASMFQSVATLAASTGATLPGNMPMMAGQAFLAEIAAPILADFLAATPDVPMLPDAPTLPNAMSGHGLYGPMQACIARAVALSEQPKFKPSLVTNVLAVLNLLHPEVFDAVAHRVRAAGHILQDKKIKLAAVNLSEKVERITVTHDKWEYDAKTGAIEADNPDNLLVLLGILGLDIRWNAWTEKMQVQGTIDADFLYPDWINIDDVFVAKIITRAKRTKTRFKLGKDFCWESLTTFAHANTVDPMCDLLDILAKEWDGVPRLSSWLRTTCDAPDDAYHRAVSELIIGGMVRRIRQPGCKNDLMPVFFGPQGTGKSTIAKIIADMGQSTLAQIDKRSTPAFSDEVMLGDESKELVLSLAGKCLVEIGEMGQRNSAKIDHVKAMLSRQVDRGRTAYSRSVTERPRRNIFFGTVNGDQPLSDESGNRRFLPISVPNELHLQWLSDNIRAIAGEAAVLEAKGADFALPRDVWTVAAQYQEAARAQSDFEIHLNGWFADKTHPGYIMAHDLQSLLKDATGRSIAPNQYGRAMQSLGFESKLYRVNGKPAQIWYRGPMPSLQYQISREPNGRLMPKQIFAGMTALRTA